jgi:hypothetical protein
MCTKRVVERRRSRRNEEDVGVFTEMMDRRTPVGNGSTQVRDMCERNRMRR